MICVVVDPSDSLVRVGQGWFRPIVSGNSAPSITYLFRDEFAIDEAAPLASPRQADVGRLHVSDSASTVSISAGQLNVDGSASPAEWADPSIYASDNAGDGFTRSPGLVFSARINRDAVQEAMIFGWHRNTPLTTGGVLDHLWYTEPGDIEYRIRPVLPTGFATQLAAYLHTIVRSAGALFVHDNTLVYVNAIGDDSPMWPGLVTHSGDLRFDHWRVAQLPEPFTDDYGIATAHLAGSRSAGDTFTHEADCLIYATIDTLPSSGNIEIRFRIQDAMNYWRVRVNSSGDLTLTEVVLMIGVDRGSAAGVVTAGERIGIIADGETIAVYDSTARRINYTSASNFVDETDGELESLGTDGEVSGIEVWPRVLSGDALAILEAA